jgi:type III pantothenate kinase
LSIVFSGVVPGIVNRLEKSTRAAVCDRESKSVLRFRKDLHCPLVIRPKPASEVGDDRLAAALGALAIDPRVPWVVVDAGTALTVNAVRPAARRRKATARRSMGTFEGGLIVPGEGLCLQALAGGTAQLPGLEPLASARKIAPWGGSTKDAVLFGVRRVQMATVLELARAQAVPLGSQARIVLTGGGAEVLWPVLRRGLAGHRPIREPDLVHRGLLAALDAAETTD